LTVNRGRSAAAINAAPPPVLAPNSPIGNDAVSLRSLSQSTIVTSRPIVDRFFLRCQQIDEQRSQMTMLQRARDVLVSRTVAAAAAPVREQYDSLRIRRHPKVTGQD